MSAAFLDDPDRACAPGLTDPAIFFSAADTDQALARKTCRRCPVRVDCLTYAIDDGERHGVWGGVLMSAPAERRRVLRGPALLDPHVTTLWRRGLNDVQIAKVLGTDTKTIRESRHRLGLPARDRRGSRTHQETAA